MIKEGYAVLREIFGRRRRKGAKPNEMSKAKVPEGLMHKCTACDKIYYRKEMKNNLYVCPNCDHHEPLHAWKRIDSLFDQDTFSEWDENLISSNPLDFPDYEEKVIGDQKKTKLKEAVVTGKGLLGGYETAFAVMDARFRMGSMGSVVGEKIT